MLFKSSVFKLILGGLFTLGAVSAAMVIFALYPRAPLIDTNAIGLHSDCTVSLSFTNKASNADGFRIYFRPVGAANFTLIKILPSSVNNTFYNVDPLPPPLPNGKYEYKVTAFNSYGEASDTQTIDITTCPNIPAFPNGEPLGILVNPLIVNVTLVDKCSIKVDYIDENPTPQSVEDGLHVWRHTNYSMTGAIVANLPPAASGSYLDANLPPAAYRYKVSVYKASTEVYSYISDAIQIDDSCAPPSVLQVPPTLVKLAPPPKLSCDWEAAANVFLRKGPNVGVYDRLIDEPSGKTFPIIGQSEDGTFWAVEVAPNVTGYITKSEKYSRTHGDCSSVPTVKDPPPPVIQEAPTKKPANKGNPAATPCSPDPAVICP